MLERCLLSRFGGRPALPHSGIGLCRQREVPRGGASGAGLAAEGSTGGRNSSPCAVLSAFPCVDGLP